MKHRRLLPLALVLLLAALAGCQAYLPKAGRRMPSPSEVDGQVSSPATPAATTQPPKPVEISIGMTGDVLMHDWLIKGGEQADGSYNYDHIFQYMRPEIGRLDYAIANMEGTLAGPPYTGYPLFSAPDAVADALKTAGFDMAVSANNHILDRHAEGLDRTVSVLRKAGLTTLGARLEETEPPFQIVDIKGIKVGFSAFTYETVKVDGIKGLNGLRITAEVEPRLDSFSQEEAYMPADIDKVAGRVADMRAAGAEIVVFVMHWGTEYAYTEDVYSQAYTKALADAGCDLVFACGPHVLWPVRTLTASDGDHQMLCFYSLGNAVSDQTYSTGDSEGRAEDGMLAAAKFTKDPTTGAVRLTAAGYIATYCHKDTVATASNINRIMPIEQSLADPEAFDCSNITDLLEESKTRTEKLMAENTIADDLPFSAYSSFSDSPFETD